VITYRYEKVKKNFDLIFKKAAIDGKVVIQTNNGFYVLMPISKETSPLDIEGVDMGLSSKEIVQFIHEGRKT